MKVYFVRHGESALNKVFKHQPSHTPLNEVGVRQAKAITERLRTLPMDLIITSTYPRAVQTAEEIEAVHTIPLIKSMLFTERKMPSIFDNRDIDDPEIVAIHNLIREHFEDPVWHYSDEENFRDLQLRVEKALDFLTSQQKENIVVVSHGYFLQLLLCFIIFNKQLSYATFKSFKNTVELSNTGLTVCEYKNNSWKILTINDLAHLAD